MQFLVLSSERLQLTVVEVWRKNRPGKLYGVCPGYPLKTSTFHSLWLSWDGGGGKDPATPLKTTAGTRNDLPLLILS